MKHTRDVIAPIGTVVAHPKRHVPAYAYPITGQYLLYRPLYLTVPEQPDPAVSQFIKFLFSREGQAIIKHTGTVTLAAGKQLWEAFKQPLQ